MKAHIVLAHPEPTSFNGTLAGVSRDTLTNAGYQVSISDLYAMDFDPREGAQHYAARKNPDAFHAQTEQRFNADADSLPEDEYAETLHKAAGLFRCLKSGVAADSTQSSQP